MKKFLFGYVLAVAGLTMPLASAQDFCCPPQYDSCCYEGDFNGVYFGGNLGVITHMAHRNDFDGFLTDNGGWSHNDTDVTLGLQLGYDWQCASNLFGFVIDWNWTNNEHRLRDNPDVDDSNFVNSEFDWFTTIRARAGITVCDALVYLTAGAAVARFETTWNDDPLRFNHHNTRWGWTGGVGLEYLLGCNWSLGFEFLFLHFSERNRTFSDGATTFRFGHSDSAWIGRLVLNYRFGDLCSWCCR